MSAFLLRGARGVLSTAVAWAIATLVVQSPVWSAPPDRIREVRENRVVALPGTVHPRVAAGLDLGALDPATRITSLRLVLKPSPAQQTALEQLLEEQRDPSSPNYRKWLSSEEFGELFGVSANDLAALSAWLQSHGFTVEETARASNWIAFSGSAGDLARTFRTELHRYQIGAETHFANATEISVPDAFAGVVDSVRGLNDFRPKPQRSTKARPDFTSSNSSHYLAPDDLATIYDIAALYSAGFDGTGQNLAIAGQTDINLSDIRAFRAQFGLTPRDPQLVLFGQDPGVSAGDQIEADLDLEWSGAVARNATLVYVYSQNVFESVQYAIDKNLAPVISMSYGACELGSPSSYRTMAQQANAEGITWMNSSGDSGAAGCDYGVQVATQGPAVTFPADIPEITAVGGTEFNESGSTGWNSKNSSTFASATGYLPEKAWNDTASGGGIAATGGGASVTFRKPWWQTGPGVPNDNDRDVPDLSLSASADHDGYLLYANGSLMAVGGTSASSPAFAGIVTILNQYLIAKGVQAKAGLGNINPNLYTLAQGNNAIFHDVTVGDNIVPCKTGTTGCTTGSFGYKAGPGYDMVTGLGSVDAFNLVTKWTSLPPAVGTTMTLTSNPTTIAQSASTQLTATVKAVSGTNTPTGSVAFMDGSTTLGSAALVNGSAALTVKGSTLSPGSNVVTAAYTALGSFANSTASAIVTVTVPLVATTTTLTASPASITTSGSTLLTATVKPASGATTPAGVLTFKLGSKTLGTVNLSAAGAATLTVNASSLSVGSNAVSASYAGNSTFSASSSSSVNVTVTIPAVATTTILTANPASIAQSASTVLTATVKAVSGSTAPTGTVTFTIGATVLGSAPLSAAGATLSVKGSSLAVGANTITATYSGATGFAASSASLTVIVTAPPVATTTTLSANPGTIAATGTTQLTATVKPAAGSGSPTGTVVFSAGAVSLGSAPLASNATATLTVKGSSLASGSNAITATYSGAGNFAGSANSVTVVVSTPGTPAASSNVAVSAVKGTSQQPGFPVTLQVREQAGVASTLTGLTINGTDFSSAIAAFFGTKQLAAHATLTASLIVQWSPLPANLTFVVSGIDTTGHQWSQTATIATGK